MSIIEKIIKFFSDATTPVYHSQETSALKKRKNSQIKSLKRKQ